MRGRSRWRSVGVFLGGVLALALIGFVWARLFAGGPVSLIPGGRLAGEVVAERVEDWTFARSHQYLDVESNAYTLPYSSGTWFMVLERELYVLLPRLFGRGLEDRIIADPSIRIRIEDRIYDGRAEEIGDATQIASLLGPLVRRTMSVEIGGEARPAARDATLEHGGIAIYRFASTGAAR